MTGSFACPTCGANYPLKPMLIGRPLRCTACPATFVVAADGRAALSASNRLPIAADANTASDAAQPRRGDSARLATTQPPPPPPPPSPTPTPGADPARPGGDYADLAVDVTDTQTSKPTGKSDSQRLRKTRTDRLSADQEQHRRSLAATLSMAAATALPAEPPKSVSADSDRLHKRSEPTRTAKPARESGLGKIGPAVFTDQGLREHRQLRQWWAATLGCLILITGLWFLVAMRSTQRAALEAFVAPVAAGRGRHPDRLQAIHERPWAAEVPALIALGSLHLGKTESLPLAAAAPVMASLTGLTYHRERALWTLDDARTATLWDDKRDRVSNLRRLQQAKVRFAEHALVRTQATEAGVSEAGFDLLIELIRVIPTTALRDSAARIRAGDLPVSAEICPFTGSRGVVLLDTGTSYLEREVDYEGRLLRLVGPGWPDQWRVLSLSVTARK
ncbi:MAG: hypothetical protein H0W72_10685 [Planctomycetes bacterium]|nr:hypothetical protein [Planctomycetota bacterium]